LAILGGSAGTTLDAFKLIHDARKHGARVALFGRKINLSESPLLFIRFLRSIADGQIDPREAVKAYHDELRQSGVRPLRSLPADLRLTDQSLAYS
jgi:glycine/D-amino acid oxidase-like deaminating enzyme